MDENAIKEILSKENAEFKKMVAHHRECEEELEKLKRKKILTVEDELKVKDLKKSKLVLKDKMYTLMSEFRGSKL